MYTRDTLLGASFAPMKQSDGVVAHSLLLLHVFAEALAPRLVYLAHLDACIMLRFTDCNTL